MLALYLRIPFNIVISDPSCLIQNILLPWEMKRDVEKHLRHIHLLAIKLIGLPLVHCSKIKKMVAIANKHQMRLSRSIKHTLCLKCKTVLIPCVTCRSRLVRRECGLCLVTECYCGNEKVIVLKGR
jgi:RNase P subunit RPR2